MITHIYISIVISISCFTLSFPSTRDLTYIFLTQELKKSLARKQSEKPALKDFNLLIKNKL